MSVLSFILKLADRTAERKRRTSICWNNDVFSKSFLALPQDIALTGYTIYYCTSVEHWLLLWRVSQRSSNKNSCSSFHLVLYFMCVCLHDHTTVCWSRWLQISVVELVSGDKESMCCSHMYTNTHTCRYTQVDRRMNNESPDRLGQPAFKEAHTWFQLLPLIEMILTSRQSTCKLVES